MTDIEVKATVQSVVLHGRRGPFAIASTKGIRGRITFSLDEEVWYSNDIPQTGTLVMLSGFQKKRQGWIATAARLYSFADESSEPQLEH